MAAYYDVIKIEIEKRKDRASLPTMGLLDGMYSVSIKSINFSPQPATLFSVKFTKVL